VLHFRVAPPDRDLADGRPGLAWTSAFDPALRSCLLSVSLSRADRQQRDGVLAPPVRPTLPRHRQPRSRHVLAGPRSPAPRSRDWVLDYAVCPPRPRAPVARRGMLGPTGDNRWRLLGPDYPATGPL